VTAPSIVPRKVWALAEATVKERINPAKNSCANAKSHLRGLVIGFSPLGLYVFPSAISSFKELAGRIKQSNEEFGSSFT
jgi:hypothetical protein